MRTYAALAVCLFVSAGFAADTYKIDAVHSALIFRAKHMNVSNAYGRFNDVAGTFTYDPQNPANNSVAVEVKTESIDTANEKRDQHLKSPDFFNAKQFPVITFKSTEVKKTGEHTFDITGDLMLHGVTKSVTAKATHTGSGAHPKGGQLAGFETIINIKRSDFGMKYGLEGIGDDVQIILSVEGAKQ